jgi:hypothetical protein
MVSINASQKLKPSDDPDDGMPWAQHPFGKDLIKYLYDGKNLLFNKKNIHHDYI